LYVGVVSPVSRWAAASRERAESAERELEIVRRLRRDYDQIAGRLAAVESRIRPPGEQQGLRTLLSTLAQRAAVKIDAMEERQAPSSGGYKETRMEVSLKGLSLEQAIRYLHNIESEQRLLSVKSLRIKRVRARGEEQDLLDVTFTVSAFDPAGPA
jgi:multidrug efflux pump subunit AcrA (membrane-fusion protein)